MSDGYVRDVWSRPTLRGSQSAAAWQRSGPPEGIDPKRLRNAPARNAASSNIIYAARGAAPATKGKLLLPLDEHLSWMSPKLRVHRVARKVERGESGHHTDIRLLGVFSVASDQAGIPHLTSHEAGFLFQSDRIATISCSFVRSKICLTSAPARPVAAGESGRTGERSRDRRERLSTPTPSGTALRRRPGRGAPCSHASPAR